jgi:hypothetical protein
MRGGLEGTYMLRINKNTLINDEKIECICEYGSKALIKLVKEGEKNGNIRKLKGRYGYNSFIILDDGYMILCSNNPAVYFKRQNMDRYIVISPKRHAIKQSMVREITSKPNAGQHRDIMKAKGDGRFINLSGSKKTYYYIFTINNHIYGTNTLWDMSELSKGVEQ